MPGKECFPCPAGGICQGGLHAPFPDVGYWAAPNRTGTVAVDGLREPKQALARRLNDVVGRVHFRCAIEARQRI
jgi:hypothetical protein